MVVSAVVHQWVDVFRSGVDIGKAVAVIEIDQSHRRDDEPARRREQDGLRTIVGQAIGGIIDVETLFCTLHAKSGHQTGDHQHHPIQHRTNIHRLQPAVFVTNWFLPAKIHNNIQINKILSKKTTRNVRNLYIQKKRSHLASLL